MWKEIEAAPADAILGLTEAFKADTNPEKVNLGVGVFKDDAGTTPILNCIKTAEKQLAEYSEKLSRLEKESEKIVEDYIKQGYEAKARILKEAESAAEKLQTQARRNIEHEFKQAKSKLQEEIFETSLVKAEEILIGKISGEDQDRLVDEYLRKVEAG